MSFDGFTPHDALPFVGYSAEEASRFYGWVLRLARLLRVEFAGIDKLPRGRALLVANHPFGWDVAFAIAAIWEQTGRPVWVLGEHLWWEVPLLRRLASTVGIVDGTPDNTDRLLGEDQLVLVLPGGLREAVTPRELRYHLLWGHRYGFVKAALRNRAPMVPLAALGADELFDFFGNSYDRGRRWLGAKRFPIPLPTRILPIPHRVRLRYVIGDPLPPPAPPEQANDPEVLRNARYLIRGALQELIDTELARRVGVTP